MAAASGRSGSSPSGTSSPEQSIANGEIPFKNIGGLDGFIFWWVLPKYEEIKDKVAGAGRHSGGVGAVVENEIFDYATSNSADFGLIYNSVAKTVAILVWIDDASMDTGRSGIVLPGRKTMPWKKLGQHFAAHMPTRSTNCSRRSPSPRPASMPSWRSCSTRIG